jgi:hypothetical protein
MYSLPNRMYYAQLADLTHDELYQALENIMFNCSLKLLALLLPCSLLAHKLHLSAIRQLAFVMEKQWPGVQTNICFWVFYNVQASLQHHGKTLAKHVLGFRSISEGSSYCWLLVRFRLYVPVRLAERGLVRSSNQFIQYLRSVTVGQLQPELCDTDGKLRVWLIRIVRKLIPELLCSAGSKMHTTNKWTPRDVLVRGKVVLAEPGRKSGRVRQSGILWS